MPSPTSSSPTGSGALTSRRPSPRLDADRHPALRTPRDRGDVAAHLGLAPGPGGERARVDGRDPRRADPDPERGRGQRHQSEPERRRGALAAAKGPPGRRAQRPPARSAPGAAGPARAAALPRAPAPGPRPRRGARRRAPRRYGWRRSRSASIVAGPMPLIWSSSSIEERPPCSSRILEDVPRGHGPDALDRVELLERRRTEADRPVRRRRGRGARPGRPGPLRRDDDLLAIGELRRQVDRVGGPLGPTPPARSIASVTLAPAGSS